MDDIQDNAGNVWKLGWKAPSTDQLKLRATKVRLQDYREAAGLPPLIPRSEWRPCDYITGHPLELIEDQTDIGSCSAFTATGAGNRQRFMRGQPHVKLSGFWLYDQCNGGRDNGSNIGEVNEVVRRMGIPPLDSYPKCLWKSDRNPTGVLYYREDVEVTMDTFDELATFLLGHVGLPQFPVDAGNMQRFDGDGIGVGNGRQPNHSVYGAALEYVSGIWVLRGISSWRTSFGPFKNGSWRLTERQVNDCADAEDGNGHISTIDPAPLAGEFA